MPPRAILKPALFGLASSVLVLLAFDAAVRHTFTSASAAFDQHVRAAIHSTERPLLIRASDVLTWFGSAIILPIVAIVSAALLRFRRFRDHAWFPIAAIALAELLTETAKLMVRRPRPQPWFPMHTDPWSFPSGHSLDSTACYLVCGAALLPLIASPAM